MGAWLHIGETGIISVYTGKVEVGQNARTSLTQAVAEELRAPLSSIQMVMADTALTPFDFGTVGSQTTPRMWPQIRKAAAAAREMLVDLASQKWTMDRGAITVVNGKVTAAGRSVGFGELTRGQNLTRTIPAAGALVPALEWKVAGTSVPKVNGRDIVTGAHRYTYDLKRPALQYGKVLYPPSFGAELISLDSSAAEKLPGIHVVHEGNFVGVTAPDAQAAEKALTALNAEWKTAPAEASASDVYAYFKKTAQSLCLGEPDLLSHRLHRARSP